MNNRIIIKSADEKELPVYLFEPSIAKKGAIVLIQEIFGVNDHIKAVGKKFSEKGYLVWIPEIYHRIKNNIELAYENEDIIAGKKYKDQAGWELPTMDIVSCVANLKVDHNCSYNRFLLRWQSFLENSMLSLWIRCCSVFLWFSNYELFR